MGKNFLRRYLALFNFAMVVLLMCTTGMQAQNGTFANPILPGFHPDPSICRVVDDYYLVTSSFEFFPGIPVFHSKDLVHWEQIGHALDRAEQLDLDSIKASGGVYAPTIRYNNGKFYVINTLVGKKGNFIVTADNPAGPWSNPYWIDKAPGIDPSLFFDDDGKAYYTGNFRPDDYPKDSKYREIWLQEIDLTSMKLIGERTTILKEGALHDASNAEASHLYKFQGKYFLMIAEGGTGENHAVTIFRSNTLRGPYEGNKKNPILSHRHLGSSYPIQCTGHADLVQTQKGDWWMVLLGVRPYGGFHYNLGRETFLAPVVWESGWPVVCPGEGKVLLQQAAPDLPESPVPQLSLRDNFDSSRLAFCWNFLRTPRENIYSLTERNGFLRLYLRPQSITKRENPSFIGRRQEHINFSCTTAFEFAPQNECETAGIVLLQNDDFHFRVEKLLKNGKLILRVVRREKGADTILSEKEIASKRILLKVTATEQDYSFYYGSSELTLTPLFEHADGRILSRTIAGGFTGAYIGMYASSNGTQSANHADYDFFEYLGEK